MSPTAEPRRVRILGVPMDLGADRRGVDMGPSGIRIAGVRAAQAPSPQTQRRNTLPDGG